MTAESPTVSVVLPTYNRAAVVSQAIESVLDQTYEDFELVIVDDCSTDYTSDVVGRYRDDRITYVRHDENRGESATRNTGVTVSSGEFVTFVDDDDEFHSRLLEKSMETIKTHPQHCAGTFVTYEVLRDGKRRNLRNAVETVTSIEVQGGDLVRIGGTILRSSVFESVGSFDERLTYTVDYDLWLRILEQYYLVGIDEPLYRYHKHDDQITSNTGKIIDGIENFCRKHDSLPAPFEARLRYTKGHAYARQGDLSKASEEFESAVAQAPTDLMNRYYYSATKLGEPAYRLPLLIASLEAEPKAFASKVLCAVREQVWKKLAEGEERFGFSKGTQNTQNRVLMYHSIGGANYGSIPVERFREDIAYVTSEYDVVDLPELRSDSVAEKKIALTFDDGFSDFYANALPLLREFEVPATVFVSSRSLYDDDFSHDRGVEYRYMTLAQLRELVAEELVTLGNHTRTHPDLTAIDSEELLEAEIVGAKADFEEHLGTVPARFSYPYNWYDTACIDVVRKSHDIAVVGTDWTRMGQRHWDPHLIPRVNAAKDRQLMRWELTDLAEKFGASFSPNH